MKRRNRLRRRLREAARSRLVSDTGAGYDVVLVGRPVALDLPWAALEEETARVRSRLEEARS